MGEEKINPAPRLDLNRTSIKEHTGSIPGTIKNLLGSFVCCSSAEDKGKPPEKNGRMSKFNRLKTPLY